MRLKTRTPTIADAMVENIRQAAHQFVMSGGGVFAMGNGGDDRDEHIGNVNVALNPGSDDRFHAHLKTLDLSYEAHEQLFSAALSAISDHVDSAFLFGAFVGMALVNLSRPITEPTPPQARKGGKR